MKRILVVGSANVDHVIDTPHIPAPGETVLGGELVKYPGGKGANQANAAGRLGGEPVFLAVLGRDQEGELLCRSLEAAGVELGAVGREARLATGIASIYVTPQGENAIVVAPGANSRCGRDYLAARERFFFEGGILLLQLEIPLEGVEYALGKGKERGMQVILNPAPVPPQFPEELWDKVDILTPNEGELARLSGKPTGTLPQIREACQVLLEKGVGALVVTLGKRGALLVRREGAVEIRAVPVTAVDTTGAGDTFNGALAAMLARGWSLEEAAGFANCAAALSVTRRGAQTSAPAFEEANDLFCRWRRDRGENAKE